MIGRVDVYPIDPPPKSTKRAWFRVAWQVWAGPDAQTHYLSSGQTDHPEASAAMHAAEAITALIEGLAAQMPDQPAAVVLNTGHMRARRWAPPRSLGLKGLSVRA